MATTTPAYRPKTQAERDDDIRYRNKFRDGPNDPMPNVKPERKSFVQTFIRDMQKKYNINDPKQRRNQPEGGY